MRFNPDLISWPPLWAAIFLLVACQNKNEHPGLLTIEVDPYSANPYEIEEISNNVFYIQLESCDHCYIGYIDQMIVANDKIFILDVNVTRRILVFDREGKHLYNINDDKSDPLHLIHNLSSMHVHNNELYVIDRNAPKVFKYNMDGELLKIHHLPFFLRALVVIEDSIIGRSVDPFHVDFPYTYIVFDKEFKPVRGFGYNDTYGFLVATGRTFMTWNEDKNYILLNEILKDTLYRFMDSTFEPYVYLDYGKFSLTPAERKSEQVYDEIITKNPRIQSLVSMTCDGDYMSFRYSWNKGEGYKDSRRQYLMINVVNKRLFHVSEFTCHRLTGYVDFFPQYRVGRTFYLSQPVYGFAENNGKEKNAYGIYDDVDELKKNVVSNDNPVLIVFTIKENLIE